VDEWQAGGGRSVLLPHIQKFNDPTFISSLSLSTKTIMIHMRSHYSFVYCRHRKRENSEPIIIEMENLISLIFCALLCAEQYACYYIYVYRCDLCEQYNEKYVMSLSLIISSQSRAVMQ